MNTLESNHDRDDRAAGVLLGAACGDALGVPYEFAARLSEEEVPAMVGGGLGPYAPGEYSDDTQMAVCIAESLRDHDDPRSGPALEQTARAFLTWRRDGATDIGAQTARVLGDTERALADDGAGETGAAEAMTRLSARMFGAGERSAGNGSLMRTAPLALAHLDDRHQLAETVRVYSLLTHGDPLAAQACVLWCEAIRQAVVDGSDEGPRSGLDLLESHDRDTWAGHLAEAEDSPPRAFAPNGFVVRALQAAWSAIAHTPVEAGDRNRYAAPVWAAVRAGDDTDTVAAIAGALVGARWGRSAVPEEYLAAVHGWPGYQADGLAKLAGEIVRRHGG
ncbi:ADP-ribosylglycohydrolase family protein [Nocardiopsis sp. L17-MgMaSL7]|uniref:ADP-ribosylglycohydrolase family protein n=1 Tax=Nocardiopsis sp. L17-MgMaSL7 TaxID=1938893 RepID=UPI000D70FF70|nr:ADP-ribosylglycohydrolase family protein [Nocardiopsis sp. L17-MgMaSL7]PWV47822.1 ADP-ribosylglycohydrolase [Nocardiopsis sp. L17-MgMaSL7]